MTTKHQIVVPAEPFKNSMRAMRDRLGEFITARDAIPFSLFFDHFELTGANATLKPKLLARGSFVPNAATATYESRGATIDYLLRDVGPDLDEVPLYISGAVIVDAALKGSEVIFGFQNSEIVIELPKPIPELGLGRRFLLTSIVWNDAGTLYVFAQEDESNILEIFADASRPPNAPILINGQELQISARSRMRLAAAHAFAQGPCCSGGAAPEPAPPGKLCFKLHAKVVVQPSVPIQDQINAVNSIFATANIEVRLASVENLSLPQFEDLDVGRCVQGEVTSEQSQLFQHRNGVGPADICAYWVRSMTSANGVTIGCAAHPGGIPALALMSSTPTRYVLAHEIGHVLGLAHVGNQCDPNSPWLMNPCDSFSTPPPDISGREGNTMRNVGYQAGTLRRC